MALSIKPVSPAREREAAKATPPPTRAAEPEVATSNGAKAAEQTPKTGRRGGTRSKPKLAVAENQRSPYAGERRVQVSMFLYPSLWTELEQRAAELVDDGEKASATALLVAILHFRMPADEAAATDLVREFLLERAGARGERPFEGETATERNARLFESQRDGLSRLGRAVSSATGERYGRMLLTNAIVHAHLPADAEQASLLLRAMELLKLGEEPARALLDGGELAEAS